MVKFAIFDVDGTLINSNDLHALAWHEAFAKFGHHIPTGQIRPQIGKGGDQLMPVFLSKEDLKAQGEQISETRTQLVKERFLAQMRPFPEVRTLFETLRARGVRVALASSATAGELAAYKRIANIEDLIDQETSSDDAANSKPDPDIFHAALKRLGHPPKEQTRVFGDTPYDVTAAAKAGLKTVAVLSGGFPEADLWHAGARAVYQDPGDLLRHFDEIFGG